MNGKNPHSVPHKRRGIVVEPSPLNPIKLELGLILCLAVVLLLLVPRLSDDTLVQMGILSAAGILSMVWIIVRVRRVMRRQGREEKNGQE